MRNILSLAILFFLVVSSVSAQVVSNSFGIHLQGPDDNEAPTTPTLLFVTPITDAQINVTWSTSTDNSIVLGYSVSRDGIPIATTSLLSYADTGLAASTTYAYTVRAFDPSYNYSSTSNSLATTTLSSPPPPTPGGALSTQQTAGTAARVVVDTFRIALGISTTTFFLETAHQARVEVRWGRTTSYELGYLVSNVFTKKHVVPITDLEPGTTYSYEIIGYTPLGFPTVLEQGEFTTTAATRTDAPLNVNQFQAMAVGESVALRWQLPVAPIALVRIVRSHFGFPEHPQDGAVVYEGLKTEAVDEGILAQYSPVYYTAFVYDSAGTVSSGAVAMVYRTGSNEVLQPPITVTDGTASGREATSTIEQARVTVDMKLPTLATILLRQNGKSMPADTANITLATEQGFLISIPRSAVSGNLKSIIASVGGGGSAKASSAFLLRINKDKTAYEAQVAPGVASGETYIVVAVYDYEAYVVGTYQIPVTFITSFEEPVPVLFPDVFFRYGLLVSLIIITLGGFWFWWFFVLRRWRGEDKK